MKQIGADYVLGYTIKPVIYGSLAAWFAGVRHRFALITGLGYAFTGEASGLRKVLRILIQAAVASKARDRFPCGEWLRCGRF